ncbi:hypothetical protein KKG57_02975, partial [Patescibacteria group bacterium]|nr:hypothetical protein [Patescibacteria group bacterium]
SYSPPKGGKNKRPAELTISLDRDLANSVWHHLVANTVRNDRYALSYFRKAPDSWKEQFALFGLPSTAGFNSCAEVEEKDGRTLYRFPLLQGREESIALTICFLFAECNQFVSEDTSQLLVVNTVCEVSDRGWGHRMGGSVHAQFRRWLAGRTEAQAENLVSVLEKALCSAYGGLDPLNAKLMNDLCYASVTNGGRFLLQCPGNACDVAIYPEQDYGLERDERTPFGCHNLDGARQQITLLCGLAVLSELAAQASQ